MQAEKNYIRDYSLTTRLLIAGGAIGPLLFMVVMLIEGATRPGYNAWIQAGSALSLSDQGWMQITNFIISGLLIICFALGFRRTLDGGRGALWGPLLLAAVGLGLIIAGIFVTDPALGYPPGTPNGPALATTLHGTIHFVGGGLVVFFGLPAACFVLARRWASDPQWKGWTIYSVITGILMIVFFVAFASISAVKPDGPGGLLERLSLGVGLGWMLLVAVRLLRLMRFPIS